MADTPDTPEEKLTKSDFAELRSAIDNLAGKIITQNDLLNSGPSTQDFSKLTSIMSELSDSLVSTQVALEKLADVTGKQTSVVTELTDATIAQTKSTDAFTQSVDEQTSSNNENNESTKKNTKSKDENSSALKTLGGKIGDLGANFSKFGSKLENFTSKLNQTQKDFGVSLAGAARMQVDAVSSSIKSFIDSFNSINFDQLITGVGNILSMSFDSVVSMAKEGFSGNFGAVGETAKNLAKNIGAELTKPLSGSAPKQPLDPRGKEVLEATKLYQEEFGVINKEMGAQLAQQAKDRGLNVQQLVQSQRVFATSAMGDMSRVASMQDRFFNVFQSKGMTPKIALEAITKYSELIARNGTRFADSFARAAADAKKIGVDLNKVSQFGDSIIDNFEGFLEGQAELGAMGFNFDSSRLAEIAETGSDADLFNELRSQLAATGKDITKLRRSERLALESAYGINLSDMLKMAGLTPGGGKTQEEYSEESNSLLAKLVALMAISGPVFSMLGTALSGVKTALGAGGDIVKWLTSVWGMLDGIFGLLGKGLLYGSLGLAFIVAGWKSIALGEEAREDIAKGNTGEGLTKAAASGALKGTAVTGLALLTASALAAPFTAGGSAAIGIPTALGLLGVGAAAGAVSEMSSGYQEGTQRRLGPTMEAQKKLDLENKNRQKAEMESTGFKTFVDPFTGTPRYELDWLGRKIPQSKSILNPTNPNSPYYKPETPPVKKAQGGLVTGPGTETSDSIPARLSNNEYVMPAKTTKGLGTRFLDLLKDNGPNVLDAVMKYKDKATTAAEMIHSLIQPDRFKMGGTDFTREVKTVFGTLGKYTHPYIKRLAASFKPIPFLGAIAGGGLEGYDEYRQTGSIGRGIGKGLFSTTGGIVGAGSTAYATLNPVLSAAGGATGSFIGESLFDSLFPRKPKPKKYHNGGIVGGASQELPAMLQRGEAVLSKLQIGSFGKMIDGFNKIAGFGSKMSTSMDKLTSPTGGFAKLSGIGSMFSTAKGFLQGGISKGIAKFGGKVPGLSGAMNAFSAFKTGGVKGALGSLAKGGIGKAIGGAIGTAIPIPGVGTMIGSMLGSKAGKFIGGLFGKKSKAPTFAGMTPSSEEFDMTNIFRSMVGQQGIGQSTPNAPVVNVDTSGIEQKLNNFINALQNIQINMDGAQVGKVLINASDAAMSAGVFRAQTSR